MKPSMLPVLIDRAEYEVCAAAARLVRKASGKDHPDTETLIAFQFKHRTPEGLARDYLDCTGDLTARRSMRVKLPRRSQPTKNGTRPVGRLAALRAPRSTDVSRN